MSTIDSFPRVIRSPEDMPEFFKSLIVSLDIDTDNFPYMIFIPQNRWGFRLATAKILIVLEDRIAVAEKSKKERALFNFYYKDINYIQKGMLLLHSWIKLNGLAEGKSLTSYIEYNTVGDRFLQPVIEKARAKMNGISPVEGQYEKLKIEKDKFLALIKTNYKYMNFGRDSIIAGENVNGMLLQPEIRIKYLRFLNKRLTTQHFSILTDKELIIIEENSSMYYSGYKEYGGIWNYIPLHKLENLDLNNVAGKIDLLNLIFSITGGNKINLINSPDNKNCIEDFIKKIECSKNSLC